MKKRIRRAWLAALGFVMVGALTACQSTGTSRNNDSLVGTYGTDLQGQCDVQPLLKVQKKDGQLATYIRGDDVIWHEVPARLPTADETKEMLEDRRLNGVNAAVLMKGTGAIMKVPMGWRYNETFTTRTGYVAWVPYGPIDLQRFDENMPEVGQIDSAYKRCLEDRTRERQ